MTMIRISAVHALTASIAPIEAAFSQNWPAAEVVNLCDESLYTDYARWGCETEEITRRVAALLEYSVQSGAQGILFSGSLFSKSVETVRTRMRVPVLTAYEAMIEAAFAAGNGLGLLATVPDTIVAIERDVADFADTHGLTFTLRSQLVVGAMDALRGGDSARHDALVAEAANDLVDCQALMLAQHSMGRSRRLITAVPGRQLVTSPDTAVLKLKHLLDGPAPQAAPESGSGE
ncbi:MAG: aspartate/glutamate racemase family protein [Pirellulales bacterium]|nr:aspartate/glutamate racemase family protein [Pirellulales bacterium]